MSTQPKTFLTPEQYLEIERKAEYKSEYYEGEMFVMAGAREVLVHTLASEERLRNLAWIEESRKRVEKLRGAGELRLDPLPLAVFLDDRQDFAHRPHRLRGEGVVGEHLGRGRPGFEIGVAAFDLVELVKHGKRTLAAQEDRWRLRGSWRRPA